MTFHGGQIYCSLNNHLCADRHEIHVFVIPSQNVIYRIPDRGHRAVKTHENNGQCVPTCTNLIDYISQQFHNQRVSEMSSEGVSVIWPAGLKDVRTGWRNWTNKPLINIHQHAPPTGSKLWINFTNFCKVRVWCCRLKTKSKKQRSPAGDRCLNAANTNCYLADRHQQDSVFVETL